MRLCEIYQLYAEISHILRLLHWVKLCFKKIIKELAKKDSILIVIFTQEKIRLDEADISERIYNILSTKMYFEGIRLKSNKN